ncbi:MAG: isoprenylcysteine carboxylmethyltransferase family protein [Chloroflexi bacterium]|nr:isoprenylcysteine carboxylmethyltransferase family protein [Chloroflexota bacterium]MBU1750698.1 isoprenylcysteine carboxylmethyltransferase family protein [Chloroflexota bacterium]
MGPLPANEARPTAIGRVLLKRIVALFVLILGMDLLLFVPAGTLDWPAAWVFSALYAFFLLVYMVWGTFKAPDLLKERSRVAENVKVWDKIIMGMYTVLLLATLALAGLDVGRFQWSYMPLALQAIALLGMFLAGGLVFWTILTNAYLGRMVRIQEDRGHQVVTGGPYRYVRHPMYVGIILLLPSVALFLGSWWALVPAGLIAVLMVVRTALEDRTLRAELPGYAEYAQQTRYRLLPGVW